MEQTIRQALAVLSKRNAAPYDGVLGSLPEWMPEPLGHEFQQIRNDLLNLYAPDQVREWLAVYREMVLPIEGFRSVPYFPSSISGIWNRWLTFKTSQTSASGEEEVLVSERRPISRASEAHRASSA